jgi:hypothetical protein
VRVGGLVVELRPEGFTLDDGTATGIVVLEGTALEAITLVEPDDAINAIGRVESTADGPVVVVDDAGRIVLAGDPIAAGTTPAPSAPPSSPLPDASTAPASGRLASLGDGPPTPDGGAMALVTLAVVSAISLLVTALRRRRARRLLAGRIAARLASLAGPPRAPDGGRAAEREPSTIRSA